MTLDQMGFILPTSQVNGSRGKLFGDQKVDISMSLHRPERSFSERDRLVLNLLRPHLLQAYQNAQAVTQMQQELAKLNQVLEQSNTIVLTADGKVDLMSQRASRLLKQYFQLPSLPSFRLPEPLHQWVKSQISRLTQTTDIPSPCLPLRLEWQGKQLLIRLIADQPGEQYLLLLEEQPQHTLSPESVELLGLTKREAEVLCWVAQGKTNMEIAAILSNSEHTVKKHLEHIYQKFGIQGRTAAVTYALNKLGVLRGDF
jgi:DNA-binding CsgD family transcriptional regulator